MLYTVYLERSCHTVEWVMDTLDRNTSDYLQGMGDTLKELWEIHMQHMYHMLHTLHRLDMLHILDILEISHMVVGIEDIVDTVQMVDTVDMQVHSMLDSQLKINMQLI